MVYLRHMVGRLRIGILALVLGFLLLHFSLVWLYVNPFQAEKDRSFWGQFYCTPFFSQGWTMFVPVPHNNYMLFVDYTTKGQKQQREIFQSLVARHRANRLAGYEPTLVAFTNSIHYFEHSTPLNASLNGPVRDDLYFKILKHSAINYVKRECRCEPQNARVILLIKPANGDAMRVYFD
jgi:hypothetical protein